MVGVGVAAPAAAAPGAPGEEEEVEEVVPPAQPAVPLRQLLSTILEAVAAAGEFGASSRRATEEELRGLRAVFPQVREVIFDSRAEAVPAPEEAGAVYRWLATRKDDTEAFTWYRPVLISEVLEPEVEELPGQLVTFYSAEAPAWLGNPEDVGDLLRAAGRELAEHEIEPAVPVEREEMGARQPRIKRAPLAPTARQRELHNLTHTRFRTWCRACASGRGRRAPHVTRGRDGEPRGHEVSADFWYLRKRQNKLVVEPEDEDEVDDPREPTAADQAAEMAFAGVGAAEGAEAPADFVRRPCLVLWEAKERALASFMLPCKALSNPFALRTCVRTIDEEWGLAGERVVLRGDGEPALQALLKAVAARRQGPSPVEVSPPGDHAANGAAEQGVRLAQGYARTLLAGLAIQQGVDDLPANSMLVPWAVRHGGWLYTRFAERHDGGTAWEGLHQKAYRGALAEFGEKVLHLRPDADRGSKLAQRFAPGLFLGREERTGRYLIATPKGVVRSEQFMRLPVEEAFDRGFLEALHGVPWDTAGQLGLSPDEAEEEPAAPAAVPAELPAPRARAREEPGSRRPKLDRGVLKKFGATVGCAGCTFVQGKGPQRPHTGACRTRLEGRIVREKEEELREALERENALDPDHAQDAAQEEDQEQLEEVPAAGSDARHLEVVPGTEPPAAEQEEAEAREMHRLLTLAGQHAAAKKREREEEVAQRDQRTREALADQRLGRSEVRLAPLEELEEAMASPGATRNGAAARSAASSASAAPGGAAASSSGTAPGGAAASSGSSGPASAPAAPSPPRGEKRDTQSWLDAAAEKIRRTGAVWRPEVAQGEMAAAGLGEPEGSFGCLFARSASAVETFLVAAVRPVEADLSEQSLLAALVGQELARPVYDGASGVLLDPALVRAGRTEEIGWADKLHVWDKVPRSAALRAGKKVIGTKWLDINKGDALSPNVRSRLVAKELRAFAPWIPQEDLFAATPPGAALNLLLSTMVTRKSLKGPGRAGGKPYKMAFLDVRRAFFRAAATETVFIELPEEALAPGERKGEVVGLLRASMYGTRSAAKNWQIQLGKDMVGLGFRQARSSPCVFRHRELDARLVVHGDDLWLLGDGDALENLLPRLYATYELKSEGVLGPDPEDAKAVRSLNKLIRFLPDVGIEIEADPRHGEIVVGELGLGQAGSKSAGTPGSKALDHAEGANPELITSPTEVTAYRGMAARGLYLSQDRPELRFATKEIARYMQRPTAGNLASLKRLARFLAGRPRLVTVYRYQGDFVEPRAYPGLPWAQGRPLALYAAVDSNWADCRDSRRSTSGGAMRHGDHLLGTWCVTQAIQALSSGEAEFYALLKGSVESLGLSAVAEELDLDFAAPRVGSDASAARGMAARHGLGKVKHLELKHLWVQEAVRAKRIVVVKEFTDTNLADLMTKHLPEAAMLAHLTTAGCEFREGRPQGAPILDEGAVQQRIAMVMLGAAE